MDLFGPNFLCLSTKSYCNVNKFVNTTENDVKYHVDTVQSMPLTF